jgi:hypothetical protein
MVLSISSEGKVPRDLPQYQNLFSVQGKILFAIAFEISIYHLKIFDGAARAMFGYEIKEMNYLRNTLPIYCPWNMVSKATPLNESTNQA